MTAGGDPAGWGAYGVSVRLGGRLVLDDVTLTAPQGRITAVVGGDGAGKTTLLRVLTGTRAPRSGTVDRPPTERIGAMLEVPAVHRDLSVDENLDFVADAYGLGVAARDDRAAALLASAGLGQVRRRLAGDLSGGMRQKLAVVLALLHAPDLLVLDEPTTGVDPVSRAEVWRLLARAAADDVAVVVTTTYLDEAERAGQILVLDQGRALLQGTLDGLLGQAPGRLGDLAGRPDDPAVRRRAWRRARGWRVWAPDGDLPAGAAPVTPSFEDVAIIAQLDRETSP